MSCGSSESGWLCSDKSLKLESAPVHSVRKPTDYRINGIQF